MNFYALGFSPMLKTILLTWIFKHLKIGIRKAALFRVLARILKTGTTHSIAY